MSVVYSAAVKTTRMGAVNTAIGASGLLVIGTSALSGATGVLATIILNTTAGTVSGSGTVILTLDQAPALSASASASGTAALAEIRTSGGTVVVSGLTVSTTGANVNLSTTSINSGNTVSITSAVITHG